MNNGRFVDIQGVSDLFGVSVVSIRKYKDWKLLKVAAKRGNKDLFDREEVLLRKRVIQNARVVKGLSLSQIAERMEELMAEAKRAEVPPGVTEPTPDENHRMKVLVAEDDRATLTAIEDVFRDTYQIVGARDGVETLSKAISEKPALILLDLRLPLVDGFQVCRTLKENPITAHIPIIMITALSNITDKIKGIEAGADDYITKPFDLEELKARMKMVLRRVYGRSGTKGGE